MELGVQPLGFEDAFKKVRKGKRRLSDKAFLKFRSQSPNNLNALGKFYADKMASIAELKKLARQFSSREYLISKYVCVVLPKGPKDYRTILVPSARDRIMFSYILERIKPKILPEINQYRVFGSGKRADFPNIRSIITEIQKVSKSYSFILKIDIKKFFPSIDRDKLKLQLEPLSIDPYLFKIIQDSFSNGAEFKFDSDTPVNKKEEIRKSLQIGIPQGCAYSPLLANYYGLGLDKAVKEEGFESFRYLDDMVIFTKTKKEAEKVFEALEKAADKLCLKIHPITEKKNNKTYIQQTNQTFEYLGIEIKPDGTFEIPVAKIKKEIALIKQGMLNPKIIKRFKAEKAVTVLISQIKGWRSYYKNNFPSAYGSLHRNRQYKEQLKQYYLGLLYSNRHLKYSLTKAGFNPLDEKFYF